VVQGLGTTCTLSGIARIAMVHGVLVSALVGAKRALQVWCISLGAVFAVTSIHASTKQPSGDKKAAFMKGISGGDSASLSVGLVGLTDVFDKVLDTFPELSRPAMAALRDAAPAELLLRFMTMTSIHMRMAPHPKGKETAPRDFMGPQGGNGVERDGVDSNENAPGAMPDKQGFEHVRHDEAKEGAVMEGFQGMIDAQCAPVGEPASEEDLEARSPHSAHAAATQRTRDGKCVAMST
jgi:hypothetical protein